MCWRRYMAKAVQQNKWSEVRRASFNLSDSDPVIHSPTIQTQAGSARQRHLVVLTDPVTEWVTESVTSVSERVINGHAHVTVSVTVGVTVSFTGWLSRELHSLSTGLDGSFNDSINHSLI